MWPRPQVCLGFILKWPADMPARLQPESALNGVIEPKEQELHLSGFDLPIVTGVLCRRGLCCVPTVLVPCDHKRTSANLEG
jgi:hypothetical protein